MDGIGIIIVLIVRAGIGAWIGNNRQIGNIWGAVLGLFLGIIGWIIAACSKKNNTPMFTDAHGGDNK
ncbi:MAG: hypothetical protein IKJ40_02575 [Bacteroidales bacterium]|nr:hypothetical protein [Bacteroidales bacterium]